MKWSMVPSQHNRFRYVAGGLAVFLSIGVLSGCALFPKEAEEEELPVIQAPKLSQKPLYTVGTATLEAKVSGGGKMMSMNERTLFFTEEGKRLKEIYVNSGDKVSKGQVLAELDMSEVESQLQQKRLQTRKDELQMIDLLRRAEEMDPSQLEQAKLDFELKRTELTKLEASLVKSKLVAPFDGTVVTIQAKRGDSMTAYQPVMLVSDLSKLTVAVNFDAEDMKRIAPGMKAVVDINASGTHEGLVERLPLKTNTSTGMYGSGYDQNGNPIPESPETFTLITIDPFPKEIGRDTPLSASVVVERKENVVTIPPSALRTHSGRTYVIVQDEKGNKREADVETGMQTATQIEIISGLSVGQRVVGR